jgi:heat-inducible transcriptional repressor
LSKREREILREVVDLYLASGEPVASAVLARASRTGLSPASLRTVMAELEDKGFLIQPHTSAGRVPTDLGYRLYVDVLMDRPRLSHAEVQRIEQRVNPPAGEVEDVLRETGRLLSALSLYVAVVLAPKLHDSQFHRVQFVSLSRDQVLAVLVTDADMVHHKVVKLDEEMSQDDLDRASRYLTDLLEGRTLGEVRRLLVTQMAEEKAQYDHMLAQALRLGAEALKSEGEVDVYVAGAAHMADQPEFADIDKMKTLFRAFEEKSKLVKILDECLTGEDIKVFIGHEVPVRDIEGLSVIAAPYRRGSRPLGVLGVLGPTRMDYGRALALVDTTARLVSRVLTGRSA